MDGRTTRIIELACPRCGFEDVSERRDLRCPVDGAVLVRREVAERWHRDPLLGREFGGKYLIVDVIGTGGFGAVYLALQQPMGREVALKVIRPGAPAGLDDLRARFFREARVVGLLTHESTVRLFDYGEEDGTLFMVLEYIRGPSLRRVIDEHRRLAPNRAAAIARQILEALAEAHDRLLVHRDLKPANILLVTGPFGDEKVKILDFGIAKVLGAGDEDDATVETRNGLGLGTPRYMAPEQARGEAEPRSDLYAVGVLLFEMLCGQPPFGGRTAFEILQAACTQPVPALPRDVPAGLAAIVQRALEKHPETRFADAWEMATALEPFATAGAGTRPPPLPVPPFTPADDEGSAASNAVGQAVSAPVVARPSAWRPWMSFVALAAVAAGTTWFIAHRASLSEAPRPAVVPPAPDAALATIADAGRPDAALAAAPPPIGPPPSSAAPPPASVAPPPPSAAPPVSAGRPRTASATAAPRPRPAARPPAPASTGTIRIERR